MGIRPLKSHPITGLASILQDTDALEGVIAPNMNAHEYDDLAAPVLAAGYVVNASNPAALALSDSETGVNYDAVRLEVDAQISGRQAAAHTGIENDEEKEDVRPGRLGPPHVVMVHMKGRCDIRQDLDCLSTGNFATVRSNVVVHSGKWMYEVQLESSGILQLGWTQLTEKYTPEEGVGDSPHSYAYDGKRQRRWNVTASPYGERWTAGDIITCGVDLDQGTITYWRNGRNLGVAFRNVKKGVKGAAYAAGVSLSYGERCTVNFGSVPFVHPQLGYAPLQAPPSLGKIAGAEYVAACWERLADCLVCHPFGCWSCDANKTPAPTALLKLPAKHLSPPLTWLDPALLNCTSSTQIPTVPTVDDGVVETEEHAENHLNNQHMPMSEALLLAAVLGEATGKLSSHPYLVESVFLPKVLYAASLEDPHEVGVFDAFLTLLCFALEPPELESLVINVCNALGRKVRSCAWERSKFPDSVALDALTLWNRCLRCEPWARAWIRHPRWHESLEGLLFVRQPTAADLASVVPSLAWQPGDESNANAAVLSGRTGAGEFQRDVKALEEALSHLGEAHAALFTALTSNFLSRDNFADTSSKGSELGVTIADAAPALVSFVNYLIAKNKGAERNVPPPNLSHNSVVVSTFLALLRLLGPWCEGLHAGTFAFDFSTAPILGQGTCAKEEDLSRVGGTLAHLIKEHPNLCHRSTEEPGKVDSCLSDRMTSIRVGSCMNNEHACCDYQFAWWFWDRALILYSLGVDTRVRLGFTQLQTLEHGLASMQDMMTQSDAEQSAGARELLRLSIAECKKTVEDSLRQYGWHEAWLLPWKTQTLGLKLGAVTAKFIRAVAAREGPLLAFVPECYVESMMDLLHSARRTFLDRTTVATPIKKPEDFARMGMDDIVSCAVEIMDDKRIVNPETKSVLLQGMHILLSDHESYYLVATNDTARDRFMMTLMNLVSDPRVWVQAANTFGMLLKKDEDAFGFPTARGPGYQVPYNYRQMREDLGLGRTCEEDEEEEEALNTSQRSEHNGQHADDSVSVHHTPPAAITDSGNEHENEGPPKLDSRKSFCSLSHCWLAPALLSSKSASLTFVNAVFDHTNWCVTEGLSLLESSGGTMSGMSGGMRRRQVSATLELCLSLLRILVSICANASTLIFYGEVDRDYRLPETSTVGGRKTKGWNMTRFAELVAYGLKHFAPDGNAYLALDAISSPSSSASNSNDLANSFFPTHLRADIAREILWMYLNCIVGLVFNPPTALLLKFSELDPDGPAGIVADALKQQDLDAGFVFMALNVTKSFYEDKAVGEDKREVIAFVGDYLAARNTDKMSQKMDVKEQGINEQGTLTSSLNESPQEKAPPEEFLDPIMSTVMEDPVTLPHSGVTVDRATIERHLLSSSTDPFSRAPLTLEDLIPNESLRAKIWEWHNGPSL